MSGQQTIVRDHDIVSDEAIVTDVRSAHQKILVANFRGAAIGAAAMDRAVLSDNIVVPDFDFRFSFCGKTKHPAVAHQHRAVSDEISATDGDLAFDHHVRLHDGVYRRLPPAAQ
jgi:hypothetical protein